MTELHHHYGPNNPHVTHNLRYLLAAILDRIAAIDPSARPINPQEGDDVESDAYAERYHLVLHAMHVAESIGYAAGVRHDTAEPDWPVFYIELPTGQVSWHMPAHPHLYDGHTVAEKYNRIAVYGGRVRA